MPIPNESPLVVNKFLVCSACSSDMDCVIQKSPKGRFEAAVYYCRTCKYGFEVAHPPHAMGRDVRYVAPAIASVQEIVDSALAGSANLVKKALEGGAK